MQRNKNKSLSAIITQVDDDNNLLMQMMAEMRAAPEIYRPGNYWRHYEQFVLPELRKVGLKNFRRRWNSILSTFGAADTRPRVAVRCKLAVPGAGMMGRFFSRVIRNIPLSEVRIESENLSFDIPEYFYYYTAEKFERVGLRLSDCSASLVGGPEDVIEMSGKAWTTNHLQYCSFVADSARYVKFGDGSTLCELGSGIGRNAEIWAKLWRKATIVLFDIPPQLYVAHQYLAKVFGERVVHYNLTRDYCPSGEDVDARFQGKIILLPSWNMPRWKSVKVTGFWNSASFQEMEPSIVRNYLELVNSMSPDWIYINALPEGNYWGAWKPGRGGTKARVTEELYMASLKDRYVLEGRYMTDNFLRKKDYVSYLFRRR